MNLQNERATMQRAHRSAWRDRIRAYLLKKHMTHQQLADAIGVGKQAVNGWTAGYNTPDQTSQDRLLSLGI